MAESEDPELKEFLDKEIERVKAEFLANRTKGPLSGSQPTEQVATSSRHDSFEKEAGKDETSKGEASNVEIGEGEEKDQTTQLSTTNPDSMDLQTEFQTPTSKSLQIGSPGEFNRKCTVINSNYSHTMSLGSIPGR